MSDAATRAVPRFRLLFISSYYLFPGTRFGGSKRLLYFAHEWERRARLSLVCMDGCREWDGSPGAGKGFSDFLMVPATDKPRGWDRVGVAPPDRRQALRPEADRIRGFLRGKEFDAVLLAYPWSLSFVGPMLAGVDAPVFFMDDDLILEQFQAQRDAAARPWTRWLKGLRFRQTLAFYRARLAGAKAFIGITPQEAGAMAGFVPGLRAHVIKYALPLDEYPRLPAAAKDVVGFIGNFGHLPNRDALGWMLESLAPAIRARRPSARFLIAGRGLPADIKARFADLPGLEWREDVPDLAGFYADISVFLCPVRTGRGMRTKVLEAAAFGRPIATTPLGAEGLDDLDLSVAADAEGLAEACARLLAESPEASVARNRRTVEERYAVEKVAARFLSLMGAA